MIYDARPDAYTNMPKYILLCDDEIHILRAAEFKLKKAGFEVAMAFDGEEGWALIQERKPDLVVTDCQMPHLDGLGLANRIRSTPETADIPVFMLSAKGFELSADQLQQELGIRRLIFKPFSPKELLMAVESTLGEANVVKS